MSKVRIKLVAQRMDDESLELIKFGSILLVNGESFDFGVMQDGDTLPFQAVSSDWFVGDINKVGDELIFVIKYPIKPNFSYEQAFPEDLVNVPDGVVQFPKAPEDV